MIAVHGSGSVFRVRRRRCPVTRTNAVHEWYASSPRVPKSSPSRSRSCSTRSPIVMTASLNATNDATADRTSDAACPTIARSADRPHVVAGLVRDVIVDACTADPRRRGHALLQCADDTTQAMHAEHTERIDSCLYVRVSCTNGDQ